MPVPFTNDSRGHGTGIRAGYVLDVRGGDYMVVDGTIAAVFVIVICIIVLFFTDSIVKWQTFIAEKREIREKREDDTIS